MTEKEGRPIVINMSVSLVVLILVFLGIALRQLFRLPLKIWQIMGIGAAIVLLLGGLQFYQHGWQLIGISSFSFWNVLCRNSA